MSLQSFCSFYGLSVFLLLGCQSPLYMVDLSHLSGTYIVNTFSLWLASSLLKKLDLLIYNLHTVKLILFVYGFVNFDKVIHITTATKIKIQNSSFTLKKFPRALWQVTQLLMLSSWQPLTCSLFSGLVFPKSFWVCGVKVCSPLCQATEYISDLLLRLL